MNGFFFFFAKFFFLVLFNCLSWHVLSLIIHKHACWIHFRYQTLWGWCFCVPWFWWQLEHRRCYENVCWMSSTLTVQITGPGRGHQESTLQFRKNLTYIFVSCPLLIWGILYLCLSCSFSLVCIHRSPRPTKNDHGHRVRAAVGGGGVNVPFMF